MTQLMLPATVSPPLRVGRRWVVGGWWAATLSTAVGSVLLTAREHGASSWKMPADETVLSQVAVARAGTVVVLAVAAVTMLRLHQLRFVALVAAMFAAVNTAWTAQTLMNARAVTDCQECSTVELQDASGVLLLPLTWAVLLALALRLPRWHARAGRDPVGQQ